MAADLDQQPAGADTGNAPAVPADPAAIAARDAELTEMAETDAPAYYYQDDGKLAREHLAIRQAQQAKDVADKSDPEQAEDDGVDVTDIDLDAPTDDGEEPAEGEEAETEEREPLEPWQPPEGQEVSELAKPHLEALDGIAADEKQRDKIIDVYQRMVEAQQVRLTEGDKVARVDLVKGLKSELGDEFKGFKQQFDESFNGLPGDLRAALRSARLPNGQALLMRPDVVRLIHQLGANPAATGQPQQDSRTAMQRELAEIDGLMSSNIDSYNYSKWRNTGVSPSDRRMQIMREMQEPTPKPTPQQLRSEEAELLDLHVRDPQVFEYSPNWRGTEKTAARRLYEIRQGRG